MRFECEEDGCPVLDSEGKCEGEVAGLYCREGGVQCDAQLSGFVVRCTLQLEGGLGGF